MGINPGLQMRDILLKAGEFKEGDLLVGGGRDEYVRKLARSDLENLQVRDFRSALIPDKLTEALARSLQPELENEIAALSIKEVRQILVSSGAADWVRRYAGGLSSEAIAAVVKVMSNGQLSQVARALFHSLPGDRIAIGSPEHFGSRIQPNSPGDDEDEILFSILEGLSYGCGDVLIGINPAGDNVDTIVRLERLLERVVHRLKLPTRTCVLSDIVKQTRARESTHVDVGFQSLAGTSRAVMGMIGMDVDGLLDQVRGFEGLYFETGQGSEVTNGAAEGVDMVTLESRTYGLARYLRQHTGKWTIVNDVAGFIGPEVFRSPEQLHRTCLEDTVMAKLHGLTMGLDVCATFHMGIEPAVLQELTSRIVAEASPAYLMGVPGNADPMLGYLTTSFRQHPQMRKANRKQSTWAMQKRLMELGAVAGDGGPSGSADAVCSLYAEYFKEGGDAREVHDLRTEAMRKLRSLQERGWDLGLGHEDYCAPASVRSRLEAIYKQARLALYSHMEESVISRASLKPIRVRTLASSREEFLSHPSSGERVCEKDASRLHSMYPVSRPQIQLVISDGLNANAVNLTLGALLPDLRKQLAQASCRVGEFEVFVDNGRVRAGYHIGQILNADAVIHLIGERPGTGLDTLSAYLSYGRDAKGAFRWSPELDHSCTTAVCGIHPRAKLPHAAASEIARLVRTMLDQKASGVALAPGKHNT